MVENIKVLARIPLFAGLEESALEPLAESVRRVALGKGERLGTQGEPGQTLYTVLSGQLKVFTHGPGNKEIVLDIVGPDQMLGELAVLDGKAWSATVEALADCELLALDRAALLGHLEQQPQAAIHLLQNLSAALRQRVLHTEVTQVRSSAARLAHTILFLADRNGTVKPGLVTSRLNQKDLAATIGTSEEWVAQMLAEWSREGIIGLTGSRRLLLHDVAALRALSRLD